MMVGLSGGNGMWGRQNLDTSQEHISDVYVPNFYVTIDPRI
jgi:hypothetical protein